MGGRGGRRHLLPVVNNQYQEGIHRGTDHAAALISNQSMYSMETKSLEACTETEKLLRTKLFSLLGSKKIAIFRGNNSCV